MNSLISLPRIYVLPFNIPLKVMKRDDVCFSLMMMLLITLNELSLSLVIPLQDFLVQSSERYHWNKF